MGNFTFIYVDAAVGTVGEQGIKVLPLCWKSKLGNVSWEGVVSGLKYYFT